jgi:glycosyltransferase involved in cell wall biosynthesis
MQKLKKKKILVLASTFPRWKNDTTPPFIYELEKRLANNFDITILVPHYKGAKKYEEWDGIKIHRFQYFWPEGFQKLCYDGGILPNLKKNRLLLVQVLTLFFFEFVATIKIINKEKIDVVHAHWIIPHGFIATLIRKIFKIPYILTIHGSDIYGLNNRLLTYFKKKILIYAAKITVVSNSIKSLIESTLNVTNNIEVASMGVDANMFNPKKKDLGIKDNYKIQGPLILFVGRLEEVKGVRYMIEALPRIRNSFPKIRMLIIGEGPLQKGLKALVSKLNLQSSVIFLGAIPQAELPAYYATADIFISPAIRTSEGREEGFGLTFVEASFSGCLIVGTKTGGIIDIIENNKTGFLVKEKSSEEIAKLIVTLLKDRSLMKKIKNNARSTNLKRYTWEATREKFNVIYHIT